MIGAIIEATARAMLEHVLRYYDEGHVNLLVVTIIELADNKNALVAPVIEAVHSVMTRRREWMPLIICTADDLFSKLSASSTFSSKHRSANISA